MSHIVPDFESNGDYPIRELHKKLVMEGNEDIMELLWHNGQIVMQSQNLRSGGNKRSSSREVRSSVDRETGPLDLFMHEEEMASWLHYPSDENSLESYIYNNDLLYLKPPSCAPVTTASATLPPPPSVMIPSDRPLVPSIRCVEVESGPTKYTNSMNFLRPIMSVSSELGQSSSSKMAPAKILPSPSTVMASNERPTTEAPESRASRMSDIPPRISTSNIGVGVDAEGKPSMGREIETYEMSVTSSLGSGGSGASGSVEPATQKPPLSTDDRKRKGRDIDNTECHSEDVEFEDHDAKKQSYGGSTSTKRSRAAEVHNLSERKRRDRINEKMKALQDLIPRCNKSDKASMLDEAIEYLKSLQIQVQMMSMGCSMIPMMFPGVQQYVPPMAMGMGMGMVMDMGMNRTMVPYPPILPNPSLPNPAASAAAAAATATAQIGQRFPVPGLNMPSVVVGSVARQTANISAPMMSSFPHHNQIQPRVPNFVDPFQHYVGLHQTQLPLPEHQGGMPPIATKPSSTKDAINPDHNQTRNPSPLYF